MNANLATQAVTESGTTPVLVVRDVARATAFYQGAFAAAVVTRTLGIDGAVVGVRLGINGEAFELAAASTKQSAAVPLQVDDVERWWRRAVAAGCEIALPLGIGNGGQLHGMLRDPFGLVWSVSGARARRRPCLLSNLG